MQSEYSRIFEQLIDCSQIREKWNALIVNEICFLARNYIYKVLEFAKQYPGVCMAIFWTLAIKVLDIATQTHGFLSIFSYY